MCGSPPTRMVQRFLAGAIGAAPEQITRDLVRALLQGAVKLLADKDHS